MRTQSILMKGVFFLAITLSLTGCFPNKVAHMLEGSELTELPTDRTTNPLSPPGIFSARTKVFTSDGSVYLFPNGFMVRGDSVIGMGSSYAFGKEKGRDGFFGFSRDSVLAMTYYDRRDSFGQFVGSGFFGVLTPTLTYLSIYCLFCPKCCFGSCPTVYVGSDPSSDIEAECFSYCVSPFVQRPDTDLLARDVATGEPFDLRVTNEAMESHFINRFELLAVAHPSDSRVYPTEEGRVFVVRDLQPVENARTDDGEDITEALRETDNAAYRSGLQRFDELTATRQRDAITFDLATTGMKDSVTVLLRARNTLLTTALFYDVVLGPRGLNALEWTARMAEDESYAHMFYALYDEYSGVQVDVEREGRRDPVTRFGDIGPIAWKDLAIRLPVTGDVTRVSFTFFPDNISIDRIAFARETLDGASYAVRTVIPASIEDYDGMTRPEIADSIARQDESYLHVTPGDSYRFRYTLPEAPGLSTSVLLSSQGYYYEWLRGDWVQEDSTLPPLNIFDVPAIIELLRERWMTGYRMMEEEFFRNRIPLKEKRS